MTLTLFQSAWTWAIALKITGSWSLSRWKLSYIAGRNFWGRCLWSNGKLPTQPHLTPLNLTCPLHLNLLSLLPHPANTLKNIYLTTTIFVSNLAYSCTVHVLLPKILPLVRVMKSLGILMWNWRPLPIHHLRNTLSPLQWLNTTSESSNLILQPSIQKLRQVHPFGASGCCLSN